jgi:hypothetical protein
MQRTAVRAAADAEPYETGPGMSRKTCTAAVLLGLGAVLFVVVTSVAPAGTGSDIPAVPDASDNGQQTEVIEVDGPLLVGFFPVVTGAGTTGNGAVESALEHFDWALETARQCLQSTGVNVREVHAQVVVVHNRGSRDQLSLAGTGNDSIGCYLVAPGRQAHIVRASAGPSSLIVLCPAAASVYFDVPQCCPDGFRCCPDGSVRDESIECDG